LLLTKCVWFAPLNYGVFMPGMEMRGYVYDIHSVHNHLNAWNGNKGVKMGFSGFFLTKF